MSSTAFDLNVRIGEVVQASIASFIAQCHQLEEPPPLGMLVRTGDETSAVYAVVCNASTGSIDPGRRFGALGQDEATEEGVYQSHPELEHLLRTDFQALVVGHRTDGVVRRFLPPRPARMHAFVYGVSDDGVRDLTSALDFLHILVDAPVPTRDDALASCLRLASRCHPDPRAFLLAAGRELASLLARDTRRLNVLLRLIVA